MNKSDDKMTGSLNRVHEFVSAIVTAGSKYDYVNGKGIVSDAHAILKDIETLEEARRTPAETVSREQRERDFVAGWNATMMGNGGTIQQNLDAYLAKNPAPQPVSTGEDRLTEAVKLLRGVYTGAYLPPEWIKWIKEFLATIDTDASRPPVPSLGGVPKSMWERQAECKHEHYDPFCDWCHDCQSVLNPRDAYRNGYDRAWEELIHLLTRQQGGKP